MKKTMQKVFSLLLVLSMVVCLLSVAALADGETPAAEPAGTAAVTISAATLSMKVGDAAQTLTLANVPEGATVTWTSSNETVAAVAGGVVTAVAAGTADITATVTPAAAVSESGGDASAQEAEAAQVLTCTVTVAAAAEPFSGSTKWAKTGVAAYTNSDGITVSIDQENDENVVKAGGLIYVGTVTVTIPENYSGGVANINLWDGGLQTLFADVTALCNGISPGTRVMFNVRVVNNSAHNYKYSSKSFTITDTNLDNIYNSLYGVTTAKIEGLSSYTGKPVCSYATVYRSYRNSALVALGCKTTASLSDTALGSALKARGYSGIDDLAKYYIKFYNDKFKTNNTRLDQFTDAQLSVIYNGYLPDDVDSIDDLIPETNPEVSITGYDYFYNVLEQFGVSSYSSYSDLNSTNAVSANAAGVTNQYGASVKTENLTVCLLI